MWRAAPAATLYCAITLLLAGCGSKHKPSSQPAPEQSAAGHDTATGSNVTGAVASVPGLDENGPHFQSVEEWLRGRVAGLQVVQQPNGDISLRIRGIEGMLDEGDALVVIDGMPVTPSNLTGVLRSLNPREVASIQVLKDVSSTSAYGLKGAHGVVVISMKKQD